MKLITSKIIVELQKSAITNVFDKTSFENLSAVILDSVNKMHASIPANKRISYGIVHTIKELGQFLSEIYCNHNAGLFKISSGLYNNSVSMESKAVALNMLTISGLSDPISALPYFEKAAADENWELREISQILFRRLIKKNQETIQTFLLRLVKSEDPNVRRFVGETLRPVCENKWLYKQPEYSLSIIKHLFSESKLYPRTSVGNNLSDLSRHQPGLIYQTVEKLVASGDKNSYWIAYRACRNLVKKEPEKVMKLLQTETYKYKDRIHSLE